METEGWGVTNRSFTLKHTREDWNRQEVMVPRWCPLTLHQWKKSGRGKQDWRRRTSYTRPTASNTPEASSPQQSRQDENRWGQSTTEVVTPVHSNRQNPPTHTDIHVSPKSDNSWVHDCDVCLFSNNIIIIYVVIVTQVFVYMPMCPWATNLNPVSGCCVVSIWSPKTTVLSIERKKKRETQVQHRHSINQWCSYWGKKKFVVVFYIKKQLLQKHLVLLWAQRHFHYITGLSKDSTDCYCTTYGTMWSPTLHHMTLTVTVTQWLWAEVYNAAGLRASCRDRWSDYLCVAAGVQLTGRGRM